MAGLGVASTQILPPIAALPYIKITAAADMRGDALEKFRETYRGETFTSVEALCESPNVDAIYIATPNQLHARHAIAAAERGKHVIVEKPMATDDRRMRRHERSGGKAWREAALRPHA